MSDDCIIRHGTFMHCVTTKRRRACVQWSELHFWCGHSSGPTTSPAYTEAGEAAWRVNKPHQEDDFRPSTPTAFRAISPMARNKRFCGLPCIRG